MDAHELDEHIDRELDALYREFADVVPQPQIEQICKTRLEALLTTATVYDYVPLLAYRQTREELLASRRDELHQSA